MDIHTLAIQNLEENGASGCAEAVSRRSLWAAAPRRQPARGRLPARGKGEGEMLRSSLVGLGVSLVGLLFGVTAIRAQQMPVAGGQMPHGQAMGHVAHGQMGSPTFPGQDAFGAIQEIVRILEADPATDWTKVNLERLRQHLIDMHEVTLHAGVKTEQVPGGLGMDITGSGRTERAIRAMVGPHTAELNQMPEWSAKAEPIPGGVRLAVLAKDPADTATIARIRGLGFIGLLVQGGHHQPHHLAMARGEMLQGHGH
jgi:hypothetical protein